MTNYLLYHAVTPDEVNHCAWSLLRYLGIYNLKPPAGQKLVVYTNQPAFLEAYCVFFNEYELCPPGQGSVMETILQFCSGHPGNVLYFGGTVFPIVPLEPVFDAIEKGAFYGYSGGASTNGKAGLKGGLARAEAGSQASSQHSAPVVIGVNSAKQPFQIPQPGTGKGLAEFAEQYNDLSEFRLLLRNFFNRHAEESIPGLVKLAARIDLGRIRQEKQSFRRLPLLKRIARRISGQGWNVNSYIR